MFLIFVCLVWGFFVVFGFFTLILKTLLVTSVYFVTKTAGGPQKVRKLFDILHASARVGNFWPWRKCLLIPHTSSEKPFLISTKFWSGNSLLCVVTNRKNKIFLNGFSLRDALFHYLQWPTKSIPPCTWCSSGVYTHISVSLQGCSCIEIYRSLRTIKASSGSSVLWQHSFLFSTPSLPFPTLAVSVLRHSSCLTPPASLTGQLFTTVQLIRLLSFHYCFMWFICLKFFICWQKVWEMCPQWGFTSLIASWRSYKTGIIIHRSFAECFGQMCHIELFCSLINIWAWR